MQSSMHEQARGELLDPFEGLAQLMASEHEDSRTTGGADRL